MKKIYTHKVSYNYNNGTYEVQPESFECVRSEEWISPDISEENTIKDYVDNMLDDPDEFSWNDYDECSINCGNVVQPYLILCRDKKPIEIYYVADDEEE